MNTVKEFVEQIVKIEYLEDSNSYGHYPFQLFVENSDGKFEMNSLALGGDVESCYNRFGEYLKNNAKKIFMSLDFPASNDIDHDFVCIFSYIDNNYDVYAIPYDTETGEIYEDIHNNKMLDIILEEFKMIISE